MGGQVTSKATVTKPAQTRPCVLYSVPNHIVLNKVNHDLSIRAGAGNARFKLRAERRVCGNQPQIAEKGMVV